MSAEVSSPVQAFGSRAAGEFEYAISCKRHIGSSAGYEGTKRSHHSLSPGSTFENSRIKRSRVQNYGGVDDEAKDAPIYSQRHMEFLEQHKQDELTSLRNEFQQCVERKENDLQLLTQQNSKLAESCSTYQQALDKLNDDNRILKKAVTIQNQHLSESREEVQKLKVVLQQAAEEIKNLSQTNYALYVHLQANNGNTGNSSCEFPPTLF